MKLVLQKHKTACGVAALAMVLGITYRKAMRILHPKRFWWFSEATTTVGQLQGALLDYGYTSYISNKPDFHLLGKKAILIIHSTLDGKESNHAVVWDPEKEVILDPVRGDSRSLEECITKFNLSIIID